MSHSSVDLDRSRATPIPTALITGVRIVGEDGVLPVDGYASSLVGAGGQVWLVWRHNHVDRAVNMQHVVELFSDTTRLREGGT